MTRPEQPQPYPGDNVTAVSIVGAVHHQRTYRDPLGRPMTGTATFTGQTRTQSGDAVTLPAPVKVPVVDGLLQADLPPDTYRVTVALRTIDRGRISDSYTVTLGPPS